MSDNPTEMEMVHKCSDAFIVCRQRPFDCIPAATACCTGCSGTVTEYWEAETGGCGGPEYREAETGSCGGLEKGDAEPGGCGGQE